VSRCSEGGGSSHSADNSPKSSKMGGGSPRKGVHRVPLLRELFMQVGDTRDAREASVCTANSASRPSFNKTNHLCYPAPSASSTPRHIISCLSVSSACVHLLNELKRVPMTRDVC
jgi:hypothetical protein